MDSGNRRRTRVTSTRSGADNTSTTCYSVTHASLGGKYARALTAMALLAEALAGVARRSGTAAAARRATDALQIATYLHHEMEVAA